MASRSAAFLTQLENLYKTMALFGERRGARAPRSQDDPWWLAPSVHLRTRVMAEERVTPVPRGIVRPLLHRTAVCVAPFSPGRVEPHRETRLPSSGRKLPTVLNLGLPPAPAELTLRGAQQMGGTSHPSHTLRCAPSCTGLSRSDSRHGLQSPSLQTKHSQLFTPSPPSATAVKSERESVDNTLPACRNPLETS